MKDLIIVLQEIVTLRGKDLGKKINFKKLTLRTVKKKDSEKTVQDELKAFSKNLEDFVTQLKTKLSSFDNFNELLNSVDKLAKELIVKLSSDLKSTELTSVNLMSYPSLPFFKKLINYENEKEFVALESKYHNLKKSYNNLIDVFLETFETNFPKETYKTLSEGKGFLSSFNTQIGDIQYYFFHENVPTVLSLTPNGLSASISFEAGKENEQKLIGYKNYTTNYKDQGYYSYKKAGYSDVTGFFNKLIVCLNDYKSTNNIEYFNFSGVTDEDGDFNATKTSQQFFKYVLTLFNKHLRAEFYKNKKVESSVLETKLNSFLQSSLAKIKNFGSSKNSTNDAEKITNKLKTNVHLVLSNKKSVSPTFF